MLLRMKYELLQTLLPYLEEYERSYPNQERTQHFAVWLARKTAEQEQVKPSDAGHDEAARIQQLLVYLNRYARNYAKKALEGSVLGGMDEYVYLRILSDTGGMTKSDLIYRNRHEKPTGMEIIRRLLTAELVEQSDDPDDRRSKQLRITASGSNVLNQLSVRMHVVWELVTGNLNSAEKLLMLQILEKLETFHQLLLARTKGGNFEETLRVLQNYLNKEAE